MFSHVMVGCSDLDRSRRFYDAVFGTLGVGPGHLDRHRIFWRSKTGVFAATLPINGEPQTVGNGGPIGFACDTPEKVDAWHAAGVENGGASLSQTTMARVIQDFRDNEQIHGRVIRRPELPYELVERLLGMIGAGVERQLVTERQLAPEQARKVMDEGIAALAPFGAHAEPLRALAHYTVERDR